MDYKKLIMELLQQMDDESTLIKIYTVVRTHLIILREKGGKE